MDACFHENSVVDATISPKYYNADAAILFSDILLTYSLGKT